MAPKFYDFYTLWSICLFTITLLLIFVDQFVDYLPGWFIAWVFANTITIGIVGTVLGTFNIDAIFKEHYDSVSSLANWQFVLHFAPMLIAFFLLLLFPTLLKEFTAWHAILACIIFPLIYIIVPSSEKGEWMFSKIKTVYVDPNQWLLAILFIGCLSFVLFVEWNIMNKDRDESKKFNKN